MGPDSAVACTEPVPPTAGPADAECSDETALPDSARADAASADTDARAKARLEGFRLIQAVQGHEPGAGDHLDAAIQRAADAEWEEVSLVLLYARVVQAMTNRGFDLHATVTDFVRRADEYGDPVFRALALALRSRAEVWGDDDDGLVAAEDDLARAVALLDTPDGQALERASAYVSAGIAYGQRCQWELEESMYAEVIALVPACDELTLIERTVLFNRAESQLSWAIALREVGEVEALRDRATAGAAAIDTALKCAMPPGWHLDMRAIGMLLAAMSAATTDSATLETIGGSEYAHVLMAELEQADEAAYVQHVQLALALTVPDRAEARHYAELATTADFVEVPAEVKQLSLRVVAEIDAADGSPGATSGLRYADYLAMMRWQGRMSALGTARARLHTERLRADHETLSRHALSDELTGLPNRRGYMRYLADARDAGVRQVGMLLIDVDLFKQVNDGHGHLAGDEVLRRLSRVLSNAVRAGDLASRLGGDEFVVVLANVNSTAVHRRANDVLAAVLAENWGAVSPGLRVSISIGAAVGSLADPEQLTGRADAALYAAKESGRSRIVVDDRVR